MLVSYVEVDLIGRTHFQSPFSHINLITLCVCGVCVPKREGERKEEGKHTNMLLISLILAITKFLNILILISNIEESVENIELFLKYSIGDKIFFKAIMTWLPALGLIPPCTDAWYLFCHDTLGVA